jgi:hypothetical protein
MRTLNFSDLVEKSLNAEFIYIMDNGHTVFESEVMFAQRIGEL